VCHTTIDKQLDPDMAFFEIENPITGKRAHGGFGSAVNIEGWGAYQL
jgi:hypothetical protein